MAEVCDRHIEVAKSLIVDVHVQPITVLQKGQRVRVNDLQIIPLLERQFGGLSLPVVDVECQTLLLRHGKRCRRHGAFLVVGVDRNSICPTRHDGIRVVWQNHVLLVQVERLHEALANARQTRTPAHQQHAIILVEHNLRLLDTLPCHAENARV